MENDNLIDCLEDCLAKLGETSSNLEEVRRKLFELLTSIHQESEITETDKKSYDLAKETKHLDKMLYIYNTPFLGEPEDNDND